MKKEVEMQIVNVRRWTMRSAFIAVAALATLLAGAGAAVWPAAPASAHNSPVAYAPAEGAVVAQQPGTFSVTTNDNLLQLKDAGGGMGLQLTGPAGAKHPLYYGDGCVTVFGPTIETQAELGEAGVYTVVWQVVSTDGHPVSGRYTFTWQPAVGQPIAAGSVTPPDCNGTAAGLAAPATHSTDAAPPAGQTPAKQGESALMAELLWVAGAFAAVVVAVVATLFLVRRKPGEQSGADEPDSPVDPREPMDSH
jgi:methionine-rich copper-binding protein CopC